MTAALEPEAAQRLTGPSEHVTPYDRLAFTDVQVEALLAGGAQRAELCAFFGATEYRTLARLATRARRTARARSGGRVIIVPGIMGSLLCLPRPAPQPQDLLWIDPVDIGAGRLLALKVGLDGQICSRGVVLYTYLRLKLQLQAQGFDVACHHYDWRLGIEELGRQLALRLQREPHARVSLVAHSMGGLVSRAALALPGMSKVERVVLLGTPNFGSFASVQALRGTYPVVRKLARLDARNSAEDLAQEVFTTFPSLYQMLPANSHTGRVDLFDPLQWPAPGPQPQPQLLQAGRRISRALAPADSRFAIIAGVGHDTVTHIGRRRGDFIYTVTRHGDGTVPTACAQLPDVPTWYTDVAHSELARDARVARAIVDLLRRGTTARLAHRYSGRSTAAAQISDRALRATQVEKVNWTSLSPGQRRIFLQNLNEPPPLRLRARIRKPLRSRRARPR